jgi:hypothetical protein
MTDQPTGHEGASHSAGLSLSMTAAEHIEEADRIVATIEPRWRAHDNEAKASIATAHATLALAILKHQEQA